MCQHSGVGTDKEGAECAPRNLKGVQHGDQNKVRDRDARKALLEVCGIVTSGSRNGLCFIPHVQAFGLLANCWGQI